MPGPAAVEGIRVPNQELDVAVILQGDTHPLSLQATLYVQEPSRPFIDQGAFGKAVLNLELGETRYAALMTHPESSQNTPSSEILPIAAQRYLTRSLRRLERAEIRSEIARKGWETRRRNDAERESFAESFEQGPLSNMRDLGEARAARASSIVLYEHLPTGTENNE